MVKKHAIAALAHTVILGSALVLAGVGPADAADGGVAPERRGPVMQGMPPGHQLGNAHAGREVYEFETFGNKGFWTDAVRLPAGMADRKVTPLQLLDLGVNFDVDALDRKTREALTAQLRADPSGRSSALLNDPKATARLISANAVIGLPAKDSNKNGVIDITKGDKVGASCALCHSITDQSLLNLPGRGSIGRRQDGRATHNLDFGSLLALGNNSRAYYPLLQLALAANGGKTLGRAPKGLTERSTEAEVDAYLTNKKFYPVGMFDDTVDGNGDPMHNAPLFRQDLAFPFGSEGSEATQDNFANLVYTILLDPTIITTPGGTKFVSKLGGAAAGQELVRDYLKVLKETGVTGFPYVRAAPPADPAMAGNGAFPAGVRVNNRKLLELDAFLFQLDAPRGVVTNAAAVARGRQVFRTTGCTSCHNVDQSKPVPSFIVPMKTIFPGDNPVVLLARRQPPLNPILNTPGNVFDDKMAVVNASIRGLQRGIALPLLLDLARKPVFLHDNSVPSLDNLFDPARGRKAPHPFFLADRARRSDLVAFLKSLDTGR